jgi:hypothetical protein
MTNPDRSKILEWAEQHGLKNLEEKIEAAEALEKKANVILTVFLAAIGACAPFGVRVFEPDPVTPVTFGFAALGLYLTTSAILFALLVVTTKPIPSVHQEPQNLTDLDSHPIDEIRDAELRSIKARIDEAGERNVLTGRYINFAILTLVFAPLVLIGAAQFKATPDVARTVRSSSSSLPSLAPASSQPALRP